MRTEKELLHADVTGGIINAFYRVYDRLGYGFLESVYRRALLHELLKAGMDAQPEVPLDVWYDGVQVGHFRADLFVGGVVIAELKASQALGAADHKQLLNYLHASDIEVGILLHFGPRPSFQRMVWSRAEKSVHAG